MILQYLVFAAFILFAVIPAVFYMENVKIKEVISWNKHVETTIGMQDFHQ